MDIKALLKKDIAGLPVWTWGLVGIGGVAIGLYFYRRAKSTSDTSTPQGTDTTTPIDTVSTGYGDFQPSGSNAGNTQPTGATINIGVPATPSNWLTSVILKAGSPVNEYASAGQPGGLPDAIVGTIPGGTTVQATGPEIVGAWNVPNGSELWYPIVYQGVPGFVSAADVSNASTSIGNQPVPPPPVNAKPTLKTTAKAPLADTPGGTHVGGKNILDIPKGATVTLESNTPVQNKYGTYYNVSYNGHNGWVNKTTIGK